MSRDKEMKEWYKRWVNAQKRKRLAQTRDERSRWCDIALGISLGFTFKFGVDFGGYLANMLGA